MANFGSDDVGFVLLGGFDLKSNLTDMSDNTEAILEETTVFGDSWQQQAYVGLRRADLSMNGFYDDAALKSAEALSTRSGTQRVLSYGLEGNTVGKNFVGYAGAMQVNVSRVASRGALHKANTQIQGSGAVEQGKVLQALGAVTAATGNTQSAPVDHAASSTSGGAGYFHINALALDGATGLLGTIRHSSDNVTYSALITFTRATSTAVVPGGERVETTAVIERYTAFAWEFGTTAAPGGATRSATVWAGLARS